VASGKARHLTVTLPARVHADLEEALARGVADGNRSALVTDAVQEYLRRLRANDLRALVDKLDPAEQVTLALTQPAMPS